MIWWVVGIIVLAAVAWFAIKVAVGFATPPATSGKALLKQMSARLGVDASAYGDACLSELVGSAVKVAELRKAMGNEHFNNAFVQQLEATALIMRGYETGDPSVGGPESPITATLFRYRPTRFKVRANG